MKILDDSIPRPRLSVAMIVRNEEDVLADTIGSVRSIADQIVALDTGSRDATVKMARALGAEVDETPWTGDFAAARNRCLKLVAGDWVLWLDAGERLDAEAAAAIRQFVDECPCRDRVYKLMVETWPCGDAASSEEVAQLRLMPADSRLQFQGWIRETLRPSINAGGMAVEFAPGRILRHPRQQQMARRTAKAQRDLRLASKEADASGGWTPRLLLVAGEACNTLGEPDKARRLFEQVLAATAQGSSEMLEGCYGLLTAIGAAPKSPDEPMTACLDALHVFPFDGQLLLGLGHHLEVRHRKELAMRAFDAANRFGQIDADVLHLTHWRELAAACLQRLTQPQEEAEVEQATAGYTPLEGEGAELPGKIRLRTDPPQTALSRGPHRAPVDRPLATD